MLVHQSLLFLAASIALVFTFLRPTSTINLIEWEICRLSNFNLFLPLIIDNQAVVIALTVLFIAGNVIIFSKTYIQSETHETRFNLLVISFVTSILLLVFIPNLIVILIGWDGLGITSFLLVVFYSKPKSLRAGIITALTNRIGDALILITIAMLASQSHWSIVSIWHSELDLLIILSVVIAACTKRAQVPFSRWLPAAIAAPTPVSALVHSSTLVTAGVFLIIRFYPFLKSIKFFHEFILATACLTILIAGVAATFEPDIKKIIALSTLSQLGVMIRRIGLHIPSVAIFHLLTHALFKALLFICAGIIIHFIAHNQDLRTTGSTFSLNITSSCFIVANLALCGSPFLAAFYSKDAILECSLFHPSNIWIIAIVFAATAFTSIYTTRALLTALWSPVSFPPANSISEDKIFSAAPMLNLVRGAIIGGAALNWLLIQPISPYLIPMDLKFTPLLAAALGALVAAFSSSSTFSSKENPNIVSANTSIWFLTPLSTQPIISLPISIAFTLTHHIDQGWQEILGGQGINNSVKVPLSLIMPLQDNPLSTQLLISIFVLLPLVYFLNRSQCIWCLTVN